jgi:predicted metal-dependent phosphoesterase TrpH
MMTAELHCHSFYSVDGWAAPEELVDMAAAAGVSTFALTDHNSVGGLERARKRAGELGLRFIDGIELDVRWRSGDYHTVAFGFDPAEARLARILAHNWSQYEADYARTAPLVERRWGVSADELRAALPTRYRDCPQQAINKWFARSYLVDRGMLPDRQAALKEVGALIAEAEAGVPREEIWPFALLEETLDAVHAAGGILLLAHVGGCSPTLEGQLELIGKMLEAGLDGFELYHLANTRHAHFPELEAEARRLGCAVSGGSDAHADPAHVRSSLGRVPVPDWVVGTIDAAIARRHGKTNRQGTKNTKGDC